MDIYLIVSKSSVTSGHGESAKIISLAGPSAYNPDNTYPAFRTKAAALDFLSKQPLSFFYSIFKMELK